MKRSQISWKVGLLLAGLGVMVGGAAATGVLLLWQARTEADRQFPPVSPIASSSEIVGDTADLPPLELQKFEAVGVTQAAANLSAALKRTPFSARVPSYVPPTLVLERFNLSAFGAQGDEEAFDLYYTTPPDPGLATRPAVHVWQTNRPYEGGDPQSPLDQGALNIAGNVWKYWLLGYPQPDGRAFELYAAESTFSDGVSIAVDIRVGYGPGERTRSDALSELVRVIRSLSRANP